MLRLKYWRGIPLAFLLSACGANTVGNDYVFNSTPEEALFVVRVVNMPGDTFLWFRETDLNSKEFKKNSVGFSLSDLLAAQLADESASGRDAKYYIAKEPPGHYAFVSRITERLEGRLNRTVVTTNCLAEGAPVYEVVAGQVNLIDLASSTGPRTVILPDGRQFVLPGGDATKDPVVDLERVLEGYPNIEGEIVLAPTVASITYDGGKNFLSGPMCPKGNTINSVDYVDSPDETSTETRR